MKHKRKIYLVAVTVPGEAGGGEIRNINLIKQLIKQANTEVEVFCISPKDATIAKKKLELELVARCHIVPAGRRSIGTTTRAIFVDRVPPFMDDFSASGIGDVFRKACEASLPDVVQIEQLLGYYCIRPHIAWLKSKGVKIVFDCHNIEFQLFQENLETVSLLRRWVGAFLLPNIKKMEIEATKEADTVFACSISDANFFRSHNQNTHIIPNGVDCSVFKSAVKNKRESTNLIFMGSVGYPPNVDAVKFYLNDIHPKIKEQMPNVTLSLIGTDRTSLNNIGVTDPSIEPLGFVEDVRPYLARAAVGICPVRYGSGTRIKIMTYMATGLPVVSTRKGAEGVAYVDGRDIILADEPEKFAEAILRLLRDRSYGAAIAGNGRDFICQNYDWNVIGKDMAHAYRASFIDF